MNKLLCDECETVVHCMKNGCIPKVKLEDDKPVVYYLGSPNFSEWGEHKVAHLAYVIGHPALGNCKDVRTSSVQSVEGDGTIITRNTIYKPLATEGMGS